ncbi:TVP38/TMEM64 family protein [Colwellia sp. MB3u-4]|uniref:TVP38/TMEM64 family protein n=1 Tax=Colwellia sp. MB3u-4 TaxID=2759822 RepID=UPI0015F5196E|nr:VTT domain-containing protein [Colwellia sp. MB3u-4]MBA6290218.1 VTT domain-containing protein [Colwellia sp. MB3u-4]
MLSITSLGTKTIVFVLFLFTALAISTGLLSEYINELWIDNEIANNGINGFLYFLIIGVLTTACGFPRQMVAFLGGYAFGFTYGTLVATVATTLGCLLSFYIARFIIRPFIIKKHPVRLDAVYHFLNQYTFSKTIIIRSLPVGSNLLTNSVAGAAKIKLKPFIAGSFIGYLPQMIVFSLAGSGVQVLSYWKISLSIILFIISTLLSALLYKQHKKRSCRIV